MNLIALYGSVVEKQIVRGGYLIDIRAIDDFEKVKSQNNLPLTVFFNDVVFKEQCDIMEVGVKLAVKGRLQSNLKQGNEIIGEYIHFF